MLIPLGGIIIGAFIGVFAAKRRGGIWVDMAQWGAVCGVILGLLGLFLMVTLDRMLQ